VHREMVLERAVLVKRADRLRNMTDSRKRGSKDESRVVLGPAARNLPATDCLYNSPAADAPLSQHLLHIATHILLFSPFISPIAIRFYTLPYWFGRTHHTPQTP